MTLRLPGGVEANVEAVADGFVLLTDTAPAGWALPPHRHLNESETIHVTGGALWLDVDGERRELRAGDTAHVPRGALHAGGTLGDEPVRRVVVFSPSGIERFFVALAGTSDPAAMLALAAEHGWRFD